MTDTHTRDEWINNQLHQEGEHAVHIERFHTGPTGYVLMVQTERQRVYFKACGALFAYEPRLAAALDAWFPGEVPRVLGVHDDHHWLLMTEAGPTVRSLIRADGDRRRSAEMLRRFAALQQRTIPHRDDLLTLGVPDRRLDRLPALYDHLITDTPALMVGHADGISATDLDRVRAFAPSVRQLCEQLAEYNLPATLHHDDFHTNNVGILDDQYVFFDWGESAIAHPFYALLIALRDAQYTLKYDPATLDHLRDVYLGCWAEYGPPDRLHEALKLTHRLAALGRALSWWQVVAHADAAYRAENADALPYWLLTFLNDTPLE
jgi:hypothetical protein